MCKKVKISFAVKIIADDWGEKIDNPKWHYVSSWGDSNRTLCEGVVFGLGEGNAIFETSSLRRGTINCEKCISIIKEIKSINL